MKFEEKISEILKLQDHLNHDEWKKICYALFLHYESKIEHLETSKQILELECKILKIKNL